ncbi:MAG: hypothetical protein JSW46_17475 [Gemmatimonadota bacterium]|nr:MAG: hypothetical protein JSW46_17475 [Gemmatimonadota bacterium]
MHRLPLLLVAAFAAAVLLPSPAAAQPAPQGFAVGVLGGVETWSLEIDEREYGPAVEGFGRYTLESGLQFAVGFTYSSMNVDAVSDNREVWDIWGDVRVVMTNWNAASGYIGARGGYVNQSLSTTINAQPLDISASGWMGAAEIGLLVELSRTLALDALGLFGFSGTGDLEADGVSVDRPVNTAWIGGLKLGLVFSFPR